MVEFIGLPGAGKTTIHEKLTSELGYYGDRHIKRKWIFEEIGTPQSIFNTLPEPIIELSSRFIWNYFLCEKHFQSFVRDHPDVIEAIDRLVTGLEHRDAERSRLKLCQSLAERDLYKYSAGVPHVCVDEGICMRTSFLFDVKGNVEPPTAYIGSIPPPDVLIHIDTPVSSCIDRMKQRERGTPQSLSCLSDGELSQWLTTYNDIIKDIKDTMNDKGTTIIEVENLDLQSSLRETDTQLSREISH